MLLLAGISFLLIFVPWVFYPLCVRALAVLRPRTRSARPEAPGDHPLVSVILATREPVAAVVARVADLRQSAYPADRLEICVTIDASGGEAAVMTCAAALPDCRVVLGDGVGGKAAALNAGVRAAAGELLVFADTYQRFDPHTVPHLAARLRDPRVAAVSGRLVLPASPQGRSPIELYWEQEVALREAEAELHSCVGVTGAVWAMRRTDWVPLPADLLNDDLYTPLRLILAGGRIDFAPEAMATEQRRTDVDREFDRKVRTLTGVLQAIALLPGVLQPWRNPVLLQLLFHKLFRFVTPFGVAGMGATAGWMLLRLSGPALCITVLAALAPLASAQLRSRAARLGRWVLTMQCAVLVALVRGARGNWNVWTR